MKKIIVTLAVLIVLSITVNTVHAQDYQPFPTKCATWEVYRCWYFYQPGWYDKYTFSLDGSDTLYDGNVYKKINIVEHHLPGTIYDSLHPSVFFGGMRESGKKIYIFQIWASVDTTSQLIYDFNNTNVGDTIFTNVLSGNPRLYGHIVMSTDSVSIGTNYHKRLLLQDTGSSFNTEYWIEGVGSSWGLPFATFWSITDNSYDLTCYNTIEQAMYENTTPTYGFCSVPLPVISCDSTSPCDTVTIDDSTVTFVSDLAQKNMSFILYPNPAQDIVTLNVSNSNGKDLLLNIYDIQGTLVKHEIVEQSTQNINIRNLNNGIYIVAIKSEDLIEYKRLIIHR